MPYGGFAGVCLFEAITGRSPFEDFLPLSHGTKMRTNRTHAMRALHKEITKIGQKHGSHVGSFIRACLQNKPEDRPTGKKLLRQPLLQQLKHDALLLPLAVEVLSQLA